MTRLVASDGTLLRSDGSVSRRTVEAVEALQRTGVRFVLATARPPRWLHGLVDVVGEQGIAICSNGALELFRISAKVRRRSLAVRSLPSSCQRPGDAQPELVQCAIACLLEADHAGVFFGALQNAA